MKTGTRGTPGAPGRWLKAIQPELPVIMLTAFGTIDSAVEADLPDRLRTPAQRIGNARIELPDEGISPEKGARRGSAGRERAEQ